MQVNYSLDNAYSKLIKNDKILVNGRKNGKQVKRHFKRTRNVR